MRTLAQRIARWNSRLLDALWGGADRCPSGSWLWSSRCYPVTRSLGLRSSRSSPGMPTEQGMPALHPMQESKAHSQRCHARGALRGRLSRTGTRLASLRARVQFAAPRPRPPQVVSSRRCQPRETDGEPALVIVHLPLGGPKPWRDHRAERVPAVALACVGRRAEAGAQAESGFSREHYWGSG